MCPRDGSASSRVSSHRDATGVLLPGSLASRGELLAMGNGIADGGGGVFELASSWDLYDDFVDRYLEDSRLTERVRQIFNTRYLMRTGNTFGNDGAGYSDQQVAAASRTHRIHHGSDPAAIRSGQAASCTPVSVSPE